VIAVIAVIAGIAVIARNRKSNVLLLMNADDADRKERFTIWELRRFWQ